MQGDHVSNTVAVHAHGQSRGCVILDHPVMWGATRAHLDDHNIHIRQQHIPPEIQKFCYDFEFEGGDGMIVSSALLRPVNLHQESRVMLAFRSAAVPSKAVLTAHLPF